MNQLKLISKKVINSRYYLACECPKLKAELPRTIYCSHCGDEYYLVVADILDIRYTNGSKQLFSNKLKELSKGLVFNKDNKTFYYVFHQFSSEEEAENLIELVKNAERTLGDPSTNN